MSNIYEKECPICKKAKKAVYNPILNCDIYEPCQCEIDRETEENKNNIRNGRNELYSKYCELCGLSGMMKSETFSSCDTDNQAGKTNKQKCIDFANNPSGNLIIIGNTGAGKTHLVSAIIHQICYHTVNDLSDSEILRFIGNGKLPKSTPAYYIRECDLRESFKSSNSFNDVSGNETIRRCKRNAILFIDDIGVKSNYTDNELSILYGIIDSRYNDNLPTVITSNLKPEEIKSVIGDRCYDRLKHNAELIIVDGTSRRKEKE